MTIDNMHDPDWWRSAVVYQIYPRSFRDSDNDGIGDLRGIESGLEYLADLGVDAIWLSPFYPSPMVDGGYDVADYRDVDPKLGTLADFDSMMEHAHSLGIKVIIDIVPNHCSNQHPWFRQALEEGPESSMRSRFVFRRGRGRHAELPPTNWRSEFGGSAWEPCGSGWYYLHLFSKEQPDFNWDNPSVREEFLSVLRFWSDRGVDGFRVDVSHGLAKDLHDPLRDRPDPEVMAPMCDDGSDPLFDRDEVHEIYRSWRTVLNQYDPPRMAVGESWTPITDRVFAYARSDELGSVFDFSLAKASWNLDEYASAITRTCRGFKKVGATPSWVLGNHDVPRLASRLALPKGADELAWVASNGTDPVVDNEVGLRRARSAAMIMLALPGTAYIYQGDELGLPEVTDLKSTDIRDPQWERSGYRIKGRDGCRVPIPWTSEHDKSFGFNKGAAPWLPQPAWFDDYSVESEMRSDKSARSLIKTALALRSKWVEDDMDVKVNVVDDGLTHTLELILASGLRSMTNFGRSSVRLPVSAKCLLNSSVVESVNGAVWLAPDATVWYTTKICE